MVKTNMRTYTRKKVQHQEIEGVIGLCRLCLQKPEEPVAIFGEDTGNYASLALRIMICVGLEMTRDENLPNIICKECYRELDRYYSFRKKCEVSYQKLKSHVLAVKERIASKVVKLNNWHPPKPKEAKPGANDLLYLGINENGQVTVVNDVNGIKPKPKAKSRPKITTFKSKDKITDFTITDVKVGNLPNLLPSIFMQLGIVTRKFGKFTMNGQPSAVELEMGDGSTVTLQLEEEDDLNHCPLSQPIPVPPAIVPKLGQDPEIPDEAKLKEASRGGRPWCGECGATFASWGSVRRHARAHAGSRPHACRVCHRAFAQREVMLRHELVHQEVRPFACGACPKSFTQRAALAAHARAHAEPHARPLRLHYCPRCPKLFLYPSGLSRHMLVHNGRVHVCGACERRFSDRSSLLRHMRVAAHCNKLRTPLPPTDTSAQQTTDPKPNENSLLIRNESEESKPKRSSLLEQALVEGGIVFNNEASPESTGKTDVISNGELQNTGAV